MDAHHATIIGCNPDATAFTVIGHAKNPGPGANSSENASNNLEKTLNQKYFKDIGLHLVNADACNPSGHLSRRAIACRATARAAD